MHQGLRSPSHQFPNPKRRNTNPSPGSTSRVFGLIGGKTTNNYCLQHVDRDELKKAHASDAIDEDDSIKGILGTLQEPPKLHSTTIDDGMTFSLLQPLSTSTNHHLTKQQVALQCAAALNQHGLEMPRRMPMGLC